eukprot:1146003-Pelagomonas_calceolata.AAC.3
MTSCVTVRAMRFSMGPRSMSCVSATSHSRGWAANTAHRRGGERGQDPVTARRGVGIARAANIVHEQG